MDLSIFKPPLRDNHQSKLQVNFGELFPDPINPQATILEDPLDRYQILLSKPFMVVL